MLSTLLNSLISLTYPQECDVCALSVENFRDGYSCRACWQRTRIFSHESALCTKCGRFLPVTRTQPQIFCRACELLHFDSARAAGIYEFALAASILSLKRRNFISKTLHEVTLNGFRLAEFYDADLLIPVPLSRRRLHERGYNQSTIIANLIGKEFNLTVIQNLLKRKKHEKRHRADMDRKGRHLSVLASFEALNQELINGKNVILIDDVLTSGATASACAKVLKRAGVESVRVFTIARAF